MTYDITFIGHMCYDEVAYYNKPGYIAPGSAVLCGAAVAARIGRRVALVTRLAEKDDHILDPLRELGVDCYVTHSVETSWMYVGHPSDNVDERDMILRQNAGPFIISDFPDISSVFVHLAGISNQEFTTEFINGLHERGYSLSADLQSFVRQADPETRKVSYRNDARKKDIVSLLDKVKLDIVEGEILTGSRDMESAARTVASWGTREVVITSGEGVMAIVDGNLLWEPFTNRSVVGRTGRGDTTFAAYLGGRLDNNHEWSLKFAASLVSLKMESVGPYSGNLQDALNRMEEDGRVLI